MTFDPETRRVRVRREGESEERGREGGEGHMYEHFVLMDNRTERERT